MKDRAALLGVLVLTIVGCGTRDERINSSGSGRIAKDSNTLAVDLNLGYSEEELFCPNGFAYDKSSRLCLSTSEAKGPFPQAMVVKCRERGGGNACDKSQWAASFARSLRGGGECPYGSEVDSQLGACASDGFVFGPFAKGLVDKCREGGGGDICATMRWPQALLVTADDRAKDFLLPQPGEHDIAEQYSLWATYYYLPVVDSIASGFALRNISGSALGPVLSRKDWCNSAMEGSVYVRTGSGSGKTYNYAGTSDVSKVDCSAYFKTIDVSRTKFRLAGGRFGDGVGSFQLVPFRTVAVDPKLISYGSVLYIPSARGQTITLPDGRTMKHDGYFFAADTGGAIKGTHIDVFIGTATANPFSWVKSSSSGKFAAKVIENETTTRLLSELH